MMVYFYLQEEQAFLCLFHSTESVYFLAVHLFVRSFVCSFLHLSGHVLLPRYLVSGFSNIDETYW